MIVLGIHDGHNASAALIINGELKCSIAEERLSRQKIIMDFLDRQLNV